MFSFNSSSRYLLSSNVAGAFLGTRSIAVNRTGRNCTFLELIVWWEWINNKWMSHIHCLLSKIINDVVINEAGKEERKFRLEGWVRVFRFKGGQSADASMQR